MKSLNLDIDDYHKAVEAFHSETDRGAAVLAGSFVESYLARYLRSFMIAGKDIENLFDGFGPFSTYSQRIESAYAFSLITQQQRTDLQTIGKVRNHLAHHPLEASFDKPPVIDWCHNLSTHSIF
ncbi:hypothetical protein JW897_02250 [Chromobacterium alkanivorans]|uniref:hypothetical protein n=1 Tax=Chromobacterium alkanivorans TaxID=1071719 RepID=UPI0019682862|nr:hypothetical protein [Chromobacterium alkanivorans]MBN3002551.1 hypothetical protein [Chromobacterium alkanivorans]